MNRLTEIGQALKQAREGRRRTLEDVALETHIKLHHLEAIEAGDESRLPEPVYVKSFIRKFAQAVGLPSDELANRYWESRPLPPLPPPSKEFAPPWWIFPWVLGILLVAALGYAWWASSRNPAPEASPEVVATPSAKPSLRAVPPPVASVSTGPAVVSPPTASPSQAAPALIAPSAQPAATPSAKPSPKPTAKPKPKPTAKPKPKPTRKPTPSPQPTPTAAQPAEETPAPSEAPATTSAAPNPKRPKGRLVLKLHATEAAWVRVVRHGHELFSDVMAPGSDRAWPVGDALSVTIGNGAGIKVTLGDRTLGTLGAEGKVVKRVFKEE
jgi:cytoskeletal protein RodZ